MFAAWAFSQIKKPVIEPGFIASTIQITAIITIYNLQLFSACIFHFFIETYFVLMKGDRLAALGSNVVSLNSRCRVRAQKHSRCSSPLSRFSRCSCAQGHMEHHPGKRCMMMQWSMPGQRCMVSGALQLFLQGSALFHFSCLTLPSCRLVRRKPPFHAHGPAGLSSQAVFSSIPRPDLPSPKDKLSKLPTLKLLQG